jgi:uncharacterized protein
MTSGDAIERRGDARRSERIVALDAIRGFAVLGILLLNIVDFAMPRYAYIDPTYYGGATGADWWAWAITFVVADGKMRGLFSMLFGASTILVAERAAATGECPARVHFSRMAVLFAVGMAHAYLIWSGDILVLYAVCGVLVFGFRKARLSALITAAALLTIMDVGLASANYASARNFEERATRSDAPNALRQQWSVFQAELRDMRSVIPGELASYRGTWKDVSAARVAATKNAQRDVLPATIPETLAMMLLGMALFRCGFLTSRWSTRQYAATIVIGYGVAVPIYAWLAFRIDRSNFDPIVLAIAQPLHLALLRPFVALAHASVLILAIRYAIVQRLVPRLAAAGRMAFTNYLATSVICTLIFYGYGLGYFGYLTRWQLYPVVGAIWLLVLGWSKPWLCRYAYGPLEWVWRSLSRLHIDPIRRPCTDENQTH